MSKVLHLTYASSISDLCEVNSSFDAGILKVAYTDKNRNGSFISKAAFERSMQTIYNCPVVCNYNRDDNSIGGHDIAVVKNGDGDMYVANLTTPVGVVPESSKPFWKTFEEDDGAVREYLCVDVLLWKRQEAYNKIKEDGIVGQSMEIAVKDGFKDKESGLYVINDFEFNAFCLLGEDVEPCFESASLEVFAQNEFKTQMQQLMNDLRDTFALSAVKDTNAKGGNVLEDVKKTPETFSDEDQDVEEAAVEEPVEEPAVESEFVEDSDVQEDNTEVASEPDQVEEPVVEPQTEDSESFALEGDVYESMYEAIKGLSTIATEWGEYPEFFMLDYDKDLSEVYVESCVDWKIYGFTYSMNGDNVVVDIESKKRMKMTYVPFDEGTQEFSFVSAAQFAFDSCAKLFADSTEKYTALEQEAEELRQFKAAADKEAEQQKFAEVFSKFEDLKGIEAFEALVSDCSEMTIKEVEEKCFAIRGRHMTEAKFALEQKAPKFSVEKEEESDEPYGGLLAKYNK